MLFRSVSFVGRHVLLLRDVLLLSSSLSFPFSLALLSSAPHIRHAKYIDRFPEGQQSIQKNFAFCKNNPPGFPAGGCGCHVARSALVAFCQQITSPLTVVLLLMRVADVGRD